jgi:AbrB family looped-hinge helix DNA binding protein
MRSMSHTITIDQAGRIVLPAELRRQLNLVPGSQLCVEVVAQRLELTPQASAPEPPLGRSATGRPVLPAGGTPFDAAAATRAEREAQAGRQAGA